MSIKNNEWMPQGDVAERILAARAKLLAKQVTDNTTTSSLIHYVRFRLGDEFYGIPFQHIREVMVDISPVRVPHTPDYIAGVINRHGALLTVIDLKPFFHIRVTEAVQKSQALVIGVPGLTMVILADNIEDSDSCDPAKLDVPLAMGKAIKPKYMSGLHRGVTAILDIEKLVPDLQSNITPRKESK